ncbi:hypothetical protein OG792_01015 [Micromonospora sp. NBC_01699]|uniref:hypothetical protein n=1 Tax=Micromonospora sp. NBC_01699 TaxID=2975984 RepID=UPI002E2C5D60|nr:hypothetical protein [Micromonospora sp. NBC_01699]
MSGRLISSLEELTSLAELTGIRVYEASARRRDGFNLEETPIDPNASELKISQYVRNDELTFRCRIEMSTKSAVLAADVAARFHLAESVEEPPKEILERFSREEGLPIVLPYLRATIQQAARQIGVNAPLLRHYWRHDLDKMRRTRAEEPATPELRSSMGASSLPNS